MEIVSKVKSGYGGGSGGAAILWIIPEGSYVEPGDKVCELDSSSLDLERIQQEIVVRNSEAAVTQAQNSHEAAKIAKEEYLSGTYKEDELTLDNQIEEATELRDRLKQYWEFSKGMHERGYVTKMQLEADYSALQQAQNKVDLAVLKRKVLEDFKKAKMVLQLDADIATSEAKLEAAKANLALDQQRLDDINEQFENCTIYTDAAGQVVYANREGRRGGEGQIVIEEGVTVRERQAIIRLPDPKDMQVTAEVNEAKISLVKVGMQRHDPARRLPRHRAQRAGRGGQGVSGAERMGLDRQEVSDDHQDPRLDHRVAFRLYGRSEHPRRGTARRAHGAGPGADRARRQVLLRDVAGGEGPAAGSVHRLDQR